MISVVFDGMFVLKMAFYEDLVRISKAPASLLGVD
jgi:hypothetical protein